MISVQGKYIKIKKKVNIGLTNKNRCVTMVTR